MYKITYALMKGVQCLSQISLQLSSEELAHVTNGLHHGSVCPSVFAVEKQPRVDHTVLS